MERHERTPDDALDRREFVQLGGLTFALPLLSRWEKKAGAQTSTALSTTDEDALDEALLRIQKAEPKSRQGLSTHAPMAVEALSALGFADRAVAWLDAYDMAWIELPRPSARIEREHWRAALGPVRGPRSWEAQNARWGDWKEFFAEELAQARWQEVLDTWVARLTPGLSGGAAHGVIRTAHAVSGLARRENAVRKGELARGLAYWASCYEQLPARERSPSTARLSSYAEAIGTLPMYWEEHRAEPPRGSIVEGLRMLHALDRFADARDLVATPADTSAALSAISAAFAHEYLRHGTKYHTLAFLHAVTGPCALRRIAPHVKPETARAAVPYAWQTAAALYSTFAKKGVGEATREPKLGRTELAARAVENGDEHAIKFTEVLLAEHALHAEPVYLAAAEDVIARL